MDFKKQKPIYLQIADGLSERIVAGEWAVDARIPSVRDLAGAMGVNPNTVMRAFDHLQDAGIIYNQRGVGYFLAPEAHEKIISEQRRAFLTEELPAIRQKMQMLGISMAELETLATQA